MGYKHSSSSIRNSNGKTEPMEYAMGLETRKRGNIWKYGVGYMKTTDYVPAFEHPAMFPEKLAQDHIISWSNPGDLILDPFAGSSTTAVACHELNRKWIMIERELRYVGLSRRRVEPIMRQTNLFINQE